MSKWLTWGALLLWPLISFALLGYYDTRDYQPFDPQGRLGELASTAHLETTLAEQFSPYVTSLTNQVFHITNEGCRCDGLTRPKVDDISARFSQAQFSQQSLDFKHYPQLRNVIPSSPAMVVFDHQGKLAYVGPYSLGVLCAPSENVAARFIDNIIAKRHLGAVAVTEVEGCYCQPHS